MTGARGAVFARRWARAVLGVCACVTSHAAAEAPDAAQAELPPPRILPWTEPWSEERPRSFVAARIDAGFPFAQARLSGGYGKPHYTWGGVELGPLASPAAVAGFAGVRFEHPVIDIRSSLLYSVALSRSFLEPRNSYDRRDVDDRSGESARYPAWDSELRLTVPVAFGAVISESELVWIPEQEGRFVYLDLLRVVAAPPWVARQRLGYEVPSSSVRGLRFAPVGEVVWLPERDDALVVRAGLLIRFWLFRTLELRVDVLPVVASPDSLGALGGEPLRVALRWQWASGH